MVLIGGKVQGKMIQKIDEYQDFNPRFEGLKLINQVVSHVSLPHISTPDVRIVPHATFLHYKATGEFDSATLRVIQKEADHLFNVSETKQLVVRRAFLVPGLQSPPGPRYLGLKTVAEVIKAIKGVFDFAIRHNYDKDPSARIEAFFYPFVDPPKFPVPLIEGIDIPKGGYAYATDDQGDIIKVLAIWGNNDGLQSLDRFDEYMVDAKNLIVLRKTIPQKRFGLFTTPNAQDEKLAVPLDKQFKQILNDIEILECAIMVSECTKLGGKQKGAEFSYDGRRLAFNEVIDREISEQEIYEDQIIRGTIVTVDREAGVERLQGATPDKIVYITKRVIEKRDYDTLNAVASLPSHLSVLYPGTTATAHAMRVLTDAGHRAFVVGDRPFHDGESVQVVISNGVITINTHADRATREILPLAEAMNHTVDEVGGKAFNLSKLMSFGFNVPQGYVITSTSMDQRELFESDEFIRLLGELDETKLYSVRSSANVEDAKNNALAGQFETILNVSRKQIQASVQEVWGSASPPHIKKVSKVLGIKEIKMAVVIQEMITPQFAGVTFGANIQTKSMDEVIAEINQGFAEEVVNGVADAMQVVFDKATGKIRRRTGVELPIPPVMLSALYQMYMQVENAFGGIQDVEWTFDADSTLYTLQTRDLKV